MPMQQILRDGHYFKRDCRHEWQIFKVHVNRAIILYYLYKCLVLIFSGPIVTLGTIYTSKPTNKVNHCTRRLVDTDYKWLQSLKHYPDIWRCFCALLFINPIRLYVKLISLRQERRWINAPQRVSLTNCLQLQCCCRNGAHLPISYHPVGHTRAIVLAEIFDEKLLSSSFFFFRPFKRPICH